MTQYALGRREEHDPRSFNFAAPITAIVLGTVNHTRHCDPFDQGNLGSCVGNAVAGALMTDPIWDGTWDLSEDDAVSLYSRATHHDHARGFYPPDDTGSSGLAGAKAARDERFITSFSHCFGLTHTLLALQSRPVLLGIPWFESMFDTDNDGVVIVDQNSGIAGGHEICAVGYDADKRLIRFANSWGKSWGEHGFAYFKADDLKFLLSQGGDATVLNR